MSAPGVIDLRGNALTKPTAEVRAAMAYPATGDTALGEVFT